MCGVVSVDGAQFGIWHHAHAAVLFPRRARRFARCFGASRALRHTCRAESRGRVVEVERGAGSQGDVRTRAVCALSHALERSHPSIALDERGYTRSFTGNLVSSVEVSDFEANLAQGSGDELAGKIRAPYSSSALAVNCFAPFKRNLVDLRVCGAEGVSSLHFEAKCPTGLRGTPPNLDVLLERDDRVVAIESKCLEYLSRHTAEFSPAYLNGIRDSRRDSAWYRELLRLVDAPRAYRWLDGRAARQARTRADAHLP